MLGRIHDVLDAIDRHVKTHTLPIDYRDNALDPHDRFAMPRQQRAQPHPEHGPIECRVNPEHAARYIAVAEISNIANRAMWCRRANTV